MVKSIKVRRPKQSIAVLKIKRQVADLNILEDKNLKKSVKLVDLSLF